MKFKRRLKQRNNLQKRLNALPPQQMMQQQVQHQPLTEHFEENVSALKTIYDQCSDVVF